MFFGMEVECKETGLVVYSLSTARYARMYGREHKITEQKSVNSICHHFNI